MEYSELDYWRGIVDGDGSLGIKKISKMPYLSITTHSDELYRDFNLLLEKHLNFKLNIHRNKRDNIYNMVILMEKALFITKLLYGNSAISIDRKQLSANSIMDYDPLKYNTHSVLEKYTQEEDRIIINNTQEYCVRVFIDRHPVSISNRRRRLKNLLKYGFQI